MGTIALKLLTIAVYSWLYQAGGRAGTPFGKSIRRYLASSLMIGALYGFSLQSETLTALRAFGIILFIVPAFFGYGGEILYEKLLRRLIYGLVFGAFAVGLGWLYGDLSLGLAQAFLSVFASVYLGVFNPLKKASEEESLIALLSVCFFPFIVS